ncbi:hypothetical protein CHLRE_09g414626v5 [Chlamydomonas reinhardtii]|uniref:Uncharacterized protein n=1 Tax=Chlamydomonas reinhardtii TaxID=3055 RepID=A0A2K3DFX0_CHLRE|nr:uncharacterized protein CHLRE_09g414626v5 [Chlamydomonas reinhardtii]PNW79426.1 hypothetical protein CHLRE_09g414626v5 [Chlamydomonas reinhardtii]
MTDQALWRRQASRHVLAPSAWFAATERGNITVFDRPVGLRVSWAECGGGSGGGVGVGASYVHAASAERAVVKVRESVLLLLHAGVSFTHTIS